MSKIFLTNYLESMVKKLIKIYPDKSVKELSDLVNENILAKFKPREASLVNTYTQSTSHTTIYDIVETMLRTKPTITGNGGLYDPDKTNMFADVLVTLIATRDHYKGLMLKYKNTDPVLSLKYNGYQSNFKIGTNSVYGLLGLKGSIINDVSIAASVTTTGQTEITNSIITVESLFGNFKFMDTHGLYNYLTTILSEVKFDIINKLLTPGEVESVTVDLVYEHLTSKCMFELDHKHRIIIGTTLDRLTKNELATLYYRNNFYEFIKITKVNQLVMSMLPHNYIDLEKHLKNEHDDITGTKKAEVLWTLVDMVVTHYHLDYNRYDLANAKLRKQNIVHTDTDSIFVGLDRFVSKYKKYREHLPNVDDFTYRYSSMTIAVYIVNKYIANVLDHLGQTLNITDDRRDNIMMKTEFLFSRVVMTSKGKWYMTKIVAQEGVVYEKPFIDIKGLSFKKSTVSADTRDFINEIVKKDVMSDDVINLAKILSKISKFQVRVKEEILGGSTAYAANASPKAADQYADPYTQGPLKAAVIWNALYPDRSIQPGDQIKTYKLIPTVKHADFMALDIPDDVKATLTKTIWEDERMAKYGLHIFGVPGHHDSLPKWVTQLVNVDVIIADSLKNILPITESMGLKTLKIRSNKYISNIIRF